MCIILFIYYVNFFVQLLWSYFLCAQLLFMKLWQQKFVNNFCMHNFISYFLCTIVVHGLFEQKFVHKLMHSLTSYTNEFCVHHFLFTSYTNEVLCTQFCIIVQKLLDIKFWDTNLCVQILTMEREWNYIGTQAWRDVEAWGSWVAQTAEPLKGNIRRLHVDIFPE